MNSWLISRCAHDGWEEKSQSQRLRVAKIQGIKVLLSSLIVYITYRLYIYSIYIYVPRTQLTSFLGGWPAPFYGSTLPKKRGHLGSRYIINSEMYVLCLHVHALHITEISSPTMQLQLKPNLFLQSFMVVFVKRSYLNILQRHSSPPKKEHGLVRLAPTSYFLWLSKKPPISKVSFKNPKQRPVSRWIKLNQVAPGKPKRYKFGVVIGWRMRLFEAQKSTTSVPGEVLENMLLFFFKKSKVMRLFFEYPKKNSIYEYAVHFWFVKIWGSGLVDCLWFVYFEEKKTPLRRIYPLGWLEHQQEPSYPSQRKSMEILWNIYMTPPAAKLHWFRFQ